MIVDGLAHNTHKFHKIGDFYILLAVMYHNSIEHRDFQRMTLATVTDRSFSKFLDSNFRQKGISAGFVLDHIQVHICSIQDIFSFEFWKISTSIHRLYHVFLFRRGVSCMSCTSYTSNDAVLLAKNINLALFWGGFLMHKRTSKSMSPVDLCFADNATSL